MDSDHSMFTPESEVEQIDSFSRESVTKYARNMKTISQKSDRPIIFYADNNRPISWYQKDDDHPVVFYTKYAMILLSMLSEIGFSVGSPSVVDTIATELSILKQASIYLYPSEIPYVEPSGLWIAQSYDAESIVECSGSLPETKNMPITPSASGIVDPSGFFLSEDIEPAVNNTLTLEIYKDGILIN